MENILENAKTQYTKYITEDLLQIRFCKTKLI